MLDKLKQDLIRPIHISVNFLSNISFLNQLLISCIVVFTWALVFNVDPISDARSYYNNALIVSQGGYPGTYWPAGYAIFLGTIFSLFSENLLVARLTNATLYLGIILITYHLTMSWFKSKQVAIMSAWLMLSYIGFLAYISLVMSEILFTFLMLAGLLATVTSQSNIKKNQTKTLLLLLISGLFFGCATMVRPQVIIIPFGFIFIQYILKQFLLRQALISVGLIYFSAVIVILPWLMHLHSTYDRFVFISTNGGVNLFMGNNPNADGSYMDNVVGPTMSEMGFDLSQARNAAESDSLYRTAAFQYLRSNTFEAVKRIPAKIYFYFRDEVSGFHHFERGSIKWAGMAISQLIYMFNIILFAYGVYAYNFRINQNPILPLFIILIFLLIILIFFGASRFRLPSIPFYLMFSSYSLIFISHKYTKNYESDEFTVFSSNYSGWRR